LELVKFVVHYGSGTIQTNQMRVDLSEFQLWSWS
jgi:hypothetical protein